MTIILNLVFVKSSLNNLKDDAKDNQDQNTPITSYIDI